MLITRICLFFTAAMLFYAVCGATDRIILENGTSIDCTILRQSAEEIVYQKDGVPATLKKSDVRSVDLDVDVDKYYNAAMSAVSADKKIAYLKKSIQNFPDKDAGRLALIQVYIAENMLDKAEELLRGRDAPSYRMLSALAQLRRGDRSGAERTLMNVDKNTLEKPQQVNLTIIIAFVRLDAGDISGAMTAVSEGKTLDKEFTKRFDAFSPKERAADFEKRLASAKIEQDNLDTAQKKKADDDAEKERLAALTRKFLSSIDIGIRIPGSFNTIFTASTGMWQGVSFGGGVSVGVSIFENYLWQNSRITIEAFGIFIDNETMLPAAYFASGSFIRQLGIRWGTSISLWITKNIFTGIGFSAASVIAGTYGNASYAAPLTSAMIGNDLHLSITAGYSFTLTPSLSLPLAAKADYILPVNLPTSRPFEFGIMTGVTWKIGL